MWRCLQLAAKGVGSVGCNPMVGAVIVEGGEIIGEGFHRKYGEAHAEVNAIDAVKEPDRLANATMYVSLEPCAHYGKTPPCAELIVEKKIPRVVVATTDPNPAVTGKGIEIMRRAGVEVAIDVLKTEADELNRVFMTNQVYGRPYVVLKWAQSGDGYVDANRVEGDGQSAVVFSNDVSSVFVHKLRTQIQGIMVGTNTAALDNPKLTSRNWFGPNPVRIVVDRGGRLKPDLWLFDGEVRTIVITELRDYPISGDGIEHVVVDFSKNINENILKALYAKGICSLMIEGGTRLLNGFIEDGLWDEAFVEVASKNIGDGVRAPYIDLGKGTVRVFGNSRRHHLKNERTQNII